MKKLSLLLAFAVLFTACSLFPTGEIDSSGEAITNCRAVAGGMAALRSGLDIPQYFLTDNPAKQGGEFDVMQYFTVLDHLSVQQGYALDYIYHYDGMGGYPILYAHPVDQPPYATEADLAAAGETEDYLSYIKTDDTPESYFQFVLLSLKGEQFYLNWHANYNDTQVVCDKSDIKDIVAMLNGEFGYRMPLVARLRAYLLGNVTPSVVIGEQTVEVQMVTFTRWGGFYQTTYTVSRSFPHIIQDVQEENLIPYDCGIMF